MPSSSRVAAQSPAISPQTATGVPALRAVRIVMPISRSTAGWNGSYNDATSWSERSIASVYWIRSLVPIDRKSSLRTKRPAVSAAAGTSIMPPTGKRSSNASPRPRNCPLARSTSRNAWSISWLCASIGSSSRALPNADARRIARSCARNTWGSARQ